MKKLIIEGGNLLNGNIRISGAKNSAVALVPAALLSDEKVIIDNIPNISDITALKEILTFLGAEVYHHDKIIEINPNNVNNKEISAEISKKLRASYYFMGALLGKYKKAVMYFPGGCSIGARPIDLHLKGFEALGAKITIEEDKYIIEAEELIGNEINLDFASVGATINIMLAAVKAKGITIIKNAAKEPEIINVATFLKEMGAKITGIGTSELKIEGVKELKGCKISVIPDRIEAGTYIIAGALAGKNLVIENIVPTHIESLLNELLRMNTNIKIYDDYIIINNENKLNPVDIKTETYPGFPTDLQQPMTTLLTQCNGISTIEENIYENRFQNAHYLNLMNGNLEINENKLIINGPTSLVGKTVKATDLRAGACLVLAALIADGTTIIEDAEHILRGYENIIDKLSNVGAKIKLEEE